MTGSTTTLTSKTINTININNLIMTNKEIVITALTRYYNDLINENEVHNSIAIDKIEKLISYIKQ